MSQQDRDNLAEASIQNYRQSALLQLPGEIRSQIYSHIFDEDIHVSKRKGTGKRPYWFGLSTACRLHDETALLPFTLGTLTFNSIEDFNRILLTGPNLSTEQLNAITKVKFLIWDGVLDAFGIVGYDEQAWLHSRAYVRPAKKKEASPLTPLQELKRAEQAEKKYREGGKDI